MSSVAADVGIFVGGVRNGGVRATSAGKICDLICVQEPLLALT